VLIGYLPSGNRTSRSVHVFQIIPDHGARRTDPLAGVNGTRVATGKSMHAPTSAKRFLCVEDLLSIKRFSTADAPASYDDVRESHVELRGSHEESNPAELFDTIEYKLEGDPFADTVADAPAPRSTVNRRSERRVPIANVIGKSDRERRVNRERARARRASMLEYRVRVG
jgi:hypothetical protein